MGGWDFADSAFILLWRIGDEQGKLGWIREK